MLGILIVSMFSVNVIFPDAANVKGESVCSNEDFEDGFVLDPINRILWMIYNISGL